MTKCQFCHVESENVDTVRTPVCTHGKKYDYTVDDWGFHSHGLVVVCALVISIQHCFFRYHGLVAVRALVISIQHCFFCYHGLVVVRALVLHY